MNSDSLVILQKCKARDTGSAFKSCKFVLANHRSRIAIALRILCFKIPHHATLRFTVRNSEMKYCVALGVLHLTQNSESITHYSLLITHYSLLITHYSLLITHYSLLITYYLLLITHYSLLITHYSLLITHYSLS
jgi:hypothetical protein